MLASVGDNQNKTELKVVEPIVIVETPIPELLGLFGIFGGVSSIIIDDEGRDNYQEAIMAHTIELDCAPGSPRPGDLFPGVLNETPLTEEDFECVSKSFGCWTWQLKEDEPDKERSKLYEENKPTYSERIKKLYGDGKVRYASW